MSATLQPFGLRPAYNTTGSVTNTRSYPNGIASGYATGILKFQPVALNASGQIVAATVGADIIGVFAGVKYVDASGIPHVYNQWIAGTTYVNSGNTITQGYGIEVAIWDDVNIVYDVQADGSVAQAIGGQVNLSNITAGSTTTGLSAATASASSLTTSAQKQLRIVELSPVLGNLWGDAYTVLRVQIAQHEYIANKVAV